MEVILSLCLIWFPLLCSLNAHPTSDKGSSKGFHESGNIIYPGDRVGRKLDHVIWQQTWNYKNNNGVEISHENKQHHIHQSDAEDSNLELISQLLDASTQRDRVIWERIPNKNGNTQQLQLVDNKHVDGIHNVPPPFNWHTTPNLDEPFYTPDHEKPLHDVRPAINRTETSTSSDCGISVGRKLLNGNQASPGQFPWIVRIAYRNKTTNRIDFRCSGSVIGVDAILTAAHCVKTLVPDLEISHVVIGDDANLDNRYRIQEIVAHPDYDKPKYSNDVALLRIVTKDKLASVCLPKQSTNWRFSNELRENSGIFAGWNTNKAADERNSVLYIKLAIVNNPDCSEAYGKFSENFKEPIIIRPTQLCAISEESQDVCQGDSGGPLMDDGTSGEYNTNGHYTVLGIVAFGLTQPSANNTACGALNFPSVYTRISSYVKWIESELQRETK